MRARPVGTGTSSPPERASSYLHLCAWGVRLRGGPAAAARVRGGAPAAASRAMQWVANHVAQHFAVCFKRSPPALPGDAPFFLAELRDEVPRRPKRLGTRPSMPHGAVAAHEESMPAVPAAVSMSRAAQPALRMRSVTDGEVKQRDRLRRRRRKLGALETSPLPSIAASALAASRRRRSDRAESHSPRSTTPTTSCSSSPSASAPASPRRATYDGTQAVDGAGHSEAEDARAFPLVNAR